MRRLLVAIAVLYALATGAQVAAQELPVGEFRVVPPSGPIGTVVMVSGDFDREITRVRFYCLYRETFDEGFDVAHTPSEPSPTFMFEYEIPAELGLRQPRTNVSTLPPRGDECFFLAEAGHRLARASVPFVVTEAALPSTGFASRSHSAGRAPTAVVMLAAGGVMLVLLGWWYSRRTVHATIVEFPS